jgi:hypothetical protein
MAIIRSTKTFEGSEFKSNGGSYLEPSVRTMNFRDKAHIEGTYVFLLEAYKEDSAGNGVWYKPLKVRDNFGLDIKEKFAVQPNCPVDYFASKMKSLEPSLAKTEKVKGEDGRDRNVYPAFGRTTWRVLYNACFFNQQGGAHVLDLPQSGGASVIHEYVTGKQPDGSDNPRINDYQAAIPVFIKLDLKAAGQPWKIQVNSSRVYPLPVELADSEYLYNLDEVIRYPNKSDLIEKLKMNFPGHIFNKCIAGYSDGSVTVSMATPATVAPNGPPPPPEDDLPYTPSAPASRPAVGVAPAPSKPLPKATIQPAPKPAATNVAPAFTLPKAPPRTAPVAEEQAEAPAPEGQGAEDELPAPPVTPAATMTGAKNFLKSRPAAVAA